MTHIDKLFTKNAAIFHKKMGIVIYNSLFFKNFKGNMERALQYYTI